MGVSVSVRVEGDPDVPIEIRSDEKFLADAVSWVDDADKVRALRLTPAAVAALKRMDSTAYGKVGEPGGAWQDPAALGAALAEVRAAVLRASKAGFLERRRFGFIAEDADEPEVAYEGYATVLDDAGKICEWAKSQGRRVALTAW